MVIFMLITVNVKALLLIPQIGNLEVVITKLPCILGWVEKENTKRLSGKK